MELVVVNPGTVYGPVLCAASISDSLLPPYLLINGYGPCVPGRW